jgi:putative chitinase
MLSVSTGSSIDLADKFLDAINDSIEEFDINTPVRQSAFLSQIGHESGGLRYVKELWGPTEAQKKYENRLDLGNIIPGDGKRYRGRGLIQITGRDNYIECGNALCLPLEDFPELLEEPKNAARSAAWFWKTHGLNELADSGEFTMITRRINGGLNGLAQRQALWKSALASIS